MRNSHLDHKHKQKLPELLPNICLEIFFRNGKLENPFTTHEEHSDADKTKIYKVIIIAAVGQPGSSRRRLQIYDAADYYEDNYMRR